MKKLIIIFVLLLSISFNSYSAAWLKLTGITIKHENQEWTNWEDVDIDICFDVSKNNQIIIYSREVQIFYIPTLEVEEREGYQISSGYVYDKNNIKAHITVFLSTTRDKVSFINIKYSNVEYMYSID